MSQEKNFRVAVKGFIVNNGKLFVMKRAKDDVQSPNIWEIPGGRLDPGEDPIIGLQREVREETGLYIKVIRPMTVRHFTRKDGQVITMLVFLCKPIGGFLQIREEHSDSKWMDLENYKEELNEFFHKEAEVFKNFKPKKRFCGFRKR